MVTNHVEDRRTCVCDISICGISIYICCWDRNGPSLDDIVFSIQELKLHGVLSLCVIKWNDEVASEYRTLHNLSLYTIRVFPVGIFSIQQTVFVLITTREPCIQIDRVEHITVLVVIELCICSSSTCRFRTINIILDSAASCSISSE